MTGRRNKRIDVALIGPSTYPPTTALGPRSLFIVGHIKIRSDKIHLKPFKWWIESPGQPADHVSSGKPACHSRQVSDRVQLRQIMPVRISVLPLRLSFHCSPPPLFAFVIGH